MLSILKVRNNIFFFSVFMEVCPTPTSSFDIFVGFASRIKTDLEIPEEALIYLDQFQQICWDGDCLASDSFTKILAAYAIRASIFGRHTRFQAVSYENDFDGLSKEWGDFVFMFEGNSLTKTLVCDSIPGNEREFVNMTIYWTTIPHDPSLSEKYSVKYYFDLGIRALELTSGTNVLCYGGGDVCKLEYEQTKDCIEWKLIPISRTRWNGNGIERAFFEALDTDENATDTPTDDA